MKACRLLLFVLSFPFAVVAHTPEAEVLTLVTRLGGSVTAAAAPGSPIVASDLPRLSRHRCRGAFSWCNAATESAVAGQDGG